MSKRNNLGEIISAFFALIVFIMIGKVLIDSLGNQLSLSNVFSGIFILGVIIIGITLIIQTIKLLEKVFKK